MTFFDGLSRYGSNIAIIEGDESTTYQELEAQCNLFQAKLGDERKLIFIKSKNNSSTLIAYLAALRANHVVMLLPPDIDESSLQTLITQFQPFCVVESLKLNCCGYAPYPIAESLALLLSTSGTTGTSKHVALSVDNVQSNTEAINTFLPIQKSDVTITTLPFHYTYGLSVINTHLQAGASIVFSEHSVLSRDFWHIIKDKGVTSFAGVPYSYEMLFRLKFTQMSLPTLRYFTQAGGKLSPELALRLSDFALENGMQFFMMYGQVEATARMSFIATQDIKEKPDSIGKAISGGEFRIVDDKGNQIDTPNVAGELCYSGPNCMLGYVEHKDQLVDFNRLEELRTGDIAYFDMQGDYFVCGRKKRFIKLQGHRINLDDIESWLSSNGIECTVVGTDQCLQILFCRPINVDDIKRSINTKFNIHTRFIQVLVQSSFPMTHSGKKDYCAVESMFKDLSVC